MRRWDEEFKPDSIARNRKMQDTAIAALGDAEFLAHLEEVKANAIEMVYRHHMFTDPVLLSRSGTSCPRSSAGPACRRARCWAC